jgi:hypothetical protein
MGVDSQLGDDQQGVYWVGYHINKYPLIFNGRSCIKVGQVHMHPSLWYQPNTYFNKINIPTRMNYGIISWWELAKYECAMLSIKI